MALNVTGLRAFYLNPYGPAHTTGAVGPKSSTSVIPAQSLPRT